MSKSNIMVVEDSGIVLLDIQKSLKALGYTVVATASSKNEAIRKADETRPDLILMDIRLGEEMGGIEAADHIREHFNIPIVFLTGYADEDTFQRAKITDPFGYILKPFDPKGLRTTIEIALHNHGLKSQLRESEKRYRTLVETMNDGVGQVDADGKLIFVNDKLCQMIGLPRDELLGSDHTSLFVEDHQELQREQFSKRRTGETGSFETTLAHKDGAGVPVILSGSPVFSEDGKFAGTIGVFTDITERKQAEKEVRKSKEALEEAEQQVHMGHYEIDAKTGEAFWSEEVFKIFGIDPKDGEPTTEAYDKLLHVDDRKKVNDLFAECIQKGASFDLVYRIIRSDGEIRYVHSSARTIKDESGSARMFGTFQDITQLKQVEMALHESEERYRTLFENSPIAIWEEDFSEVQECFDDLRKAGVKDFRGYFEKNPDEVSRLIKRVKIKNVNETSVSFFEASGKDEFSTNLSDYSTENKIEVLREELINLAEGQTKFNSEIIITDLTGNKRTLFLDLAVAPAYERKLDRVLVSFIDITERKQAEEIMLARYRLVRKSLTESLPDLLQATLDEAELLTDSLVGFFHFVEADQINLSLQAWSTNTIENMCNADGQGLHYPIDEAGVWIDCVRERRPVIHNEYELLEHRKGLPEGHVEVTRELVVPVIRGDNIVAIIGVGNKDVEYTRKDVEVVVLLADLAWDIVERKQTEAALRESEALYHDLVETAQDLIWQCDREGRYVYLNPAWEDVFGYKLDEMLGKPFTDFQESEYVERDRVIHGDILEGKSVNNFETVHIGKDGRNIHLVFNAKAVNDEQGNPVGTRGTAYDITDRKRAEDALVKSEYLLRESQEIARMGHYTLDVLSGSWESSESLNKLFGIDWEYQTDVDGWLNIIHPDDRNDMAAYFAEDVIEKRQNFDKEYRIVRVSDGKLLWVHGLGRLEFDDNGNPVRMLGNIQDITERKKSEESIRSKTSDLEALFTISAHLRVAQSADDMLPVVLAEMRRVLQSDANAVILLDTAGEHFTYTLCDGPLAVNTGAQFDVEKSISGWVLQTRQPYTTEDFASDKKKTTTLQGDENLGPAVFVPIISESEFLGVLICARNKGEKSHLYSSSEVQLLAAIGEMVGNAFRRATLYDQAMTRLQHVQTLHSIDMAISANLDLSVILDVLLTQGISQLEVDAASILLLNPHTHMLEFAAGNGFRTKEIQSARLRLGEGLPGQAAMDRKVLYLPRLSDVDDLIRKYLLDEGFVSYQAAPLIAKGQLQGVLEIYNRKSMPVSDEQISFLETLATQAAIAIDNSQLFTDLQRSNFDLEMAYDATIEGWSRALELRDQETEGHTLRVTDITVRLAQAMGVRSTELIQVRRGALLHDIGKMGVPDRILLKPGKLNDEEWEAMKLHTVYAFEMLWPIEFLRLAIDIPHCHHERWDGTGYPRQLKGEQIPLSARVFAVADVWDALTSDRPYRKAWTEEKALDYITTNAGKHFDPRVVVQFINFLKNSEFSHVKDISSR